MALALELGAERLEGSIVIDAEIISELPARFAE